MPAERTRRSGADGSKLIWTTPAEPDSAGGISFTENVTPGSFFDSQLPELVDPADFEGCVPHSPRKAGHSRKKPENHIPRPPNAFILFRSSFIKSQHVSTEVETNHSTLSKIIGLTWKTLPEGERKIWHEKAKQALDDHKRKYPTYSFRPTSTKGKGEKRKVREVGLKDMKRCAKIAELLVEGKKGRELDEAIQEFDKHHVPEIITRFETPITERAFRQRRSSSVPAPETSQLSQSFLLAPGTPRKQKLVRHVSMSPEAPALPPVSMESFGSYSINANNASTIPNFDYNSLSFTAPSPQDTSFSFSPVSPTFTPTAEGVSSPLIIDTSAQFDWSTPLIGSPITPEILSVPASPALSRCDSSNYDDVYGTSTPFASSPAADTSSFNVNPFLDDTTFKFNQSGDLSQFFPDCHSQSVPNLSIQFPPMSGLGDLGMNMGDMGHVMPLDPNFTNFMASLPALELST